MDNIAVIKISILRHLSSANGRAGSYLLYRKLKIPMADYMKAIFHLESEEFLKFDGDWLSITRAGQEFLMQSRPKSERENKRGIPNGFLREFKLSPGDPYVPSRSRLDPTLLNK